jgi:hypothetical protein
VNLLCMVDHLFRLVLASCVPCAQSDGVEISGDQPIDAAAQFARNGSDLMDKDKTYRFRASASMSQPVQSCMMRFLRLVIAEIRAALMSFLFFFLLLMLLNELSALPQKQRGPTA